MYIHKTRNNLRVKLPRYIQVEEFIKTLEAYGLENVSYKESCFSFDAKVENFELLDFVGFILQRATERKAVEYYVCLHNFVNEWRELNGNKGDVQGNRSKN